MKFVSLVASQWFGLCPKAPAIQAVPPAPAAPSECAHSPGPDGGAGRSAGIVLGAGIALNGFRTLTRNRQLLWYSLMTGLVLTSVFIAQYLLRLLGTYPYDAIDPLRWLVLTFAIELASVFCLTTLAAGLVLSLFYRDNGGPASFYDGMVLTRMHLHVLADWSVIVASVGTAVYLLLAAAWTLPGWNTHTGYSLHPVLSLFPFRFILLPEVYHIGPIGGTFAMSTAVTTTLVFLAINCLLFFATLFVVPLLVLERERLPRAVAGSLHLMKKVPGAAVSCSLVLILIVSVAAAASLFFRIVYGIVAPDMLLIWYPGDGWIAAAVLFMFALLGLVCVVSTAAGIAVTDLYTRCSGTIDPDTPETCPATAPAEPAS